MIRKILEYQYILNKWRIKHNNKSKKELKILILLKISKLINNYMKK